MSSLLLLSFPPFGPSGPAFFTSHSWAFSSGCLDYPPHGQTIFHRARNSSFPTYFYTSLILSVQLCVMCAYAVLRFESMYFLILYLSELEFENHLFFFSKCVSWLLLKTVASFQIKADLECMDVEKGCEKSYSQTPPVFFN